MQSKFDGLRKLPSFACVASFHDSRSFATFSPVNSRPRESVMIISETILDTERVQTSQSMFSDPSKPIFFCNRILVGIGILLEKEIEKKGLVGKLLKGCTHYASFFYSSPIGVCHGLC